MTEYHQHDGFGQKEDNSYGKKRVKFHERGVHDDIKYSGPLSFQSFQILGWSCIVVTVILALIKIGIRLNPEDMKRFKTGRRYHHDQAVYSCCYVIERSNTLAINSSAASERAAAGQR